MNPSIEISGDTGSNPSSTTGVLTTDPSQFHPRPLGTQTSACLFPTPVLPPTYRYNPLSPTEQEAFRLVELVIPDSACQNNSGVNPTGDRTEDSTGIECKLMNTTLATAPVYYALSYEWNPSAFPGINGPAPATPANEVQPRPSSHIQSQPQWIRVDGHQFPIQPNLYAFLTHYVGSLTDVYQYQADTPRKPPTHHFFIDAICIDQSNPDERNQQVSMMGSIFGQAETVLIWLGPDHSRPTQPSDPEGQLPTPTRKLFDFIRSIETGRKFKLCCKPEVAVDEFGTNVEEMWGTLAQLLSRSYWSRLWIVQEILLARQIRVLVGGSGIGLGVTWTSLESAILDVQLGRCGCGPVGDWRWWNDENGLNPRFRDHHGQLRSWEGEEAEKSEVVNRGRFKELAAGRHARREGKPQEGFYDVLLSYADSKCTDVRDRIFGLLPLAKDWTPTRLAVNYREHKLDLFFRVLLFRSTLLPMRVARHLQKILEIEPLINMKQTILAQVEEVNEMCKPLLWTELRYVGVVVGMGNGKFGRLRCGLQGTEKSWGFKLHPDNRAGDPKRLDFCHDPLLASKDCFSLSQEVAEGDQVWRFTFSDCAVILRERPSATELHPFREWWNWGLSTLRHSNGGRSRFELVGRAVLLKPEFAQRGRDFLQDAFQFGASLSGQLDDGLENVPRGRVQKTSIPVMRVQVSLFDLMKMSSILGDDTGIVRVCDHVKAHQLEKRPEIVPVFGYREEVLARRALLTQRGLAWEKYYPEEEWVDGKSWKQRKERLWEYLQYEW